MSEVKETSKGLQSFFSRPKKFYENVDSGTIHMTSSPTEMLYIRACRDCELRATTKLAKCIIESCSNVKIALEEPIMSGTLEMIDCQNVSVFINPRDSLPTILAERCETLHFHLVRPEAMGSVYTAQCKDVRVHFKPPHKEEQCLTLPEGESCQFVSYLSGDDMVTERVVREGAGYATTETKLAEAEKKQKELMRRFEEHVVNLLSSSGLIARGQPPASQPPASQPSAEKEKETDTAAGDKGETNS